METSTIIFDGSRRRIWFNRFVALVAIAAICVTIALWLSRNSQKRHRLTLCAGDPRSHRFEIASVFREEARRHGMHIELETSRGSQEDLEKLIDGKLDLALVGGEIGHDREEVRQVATLVNEPLHLFVRPEMIEVGLAGLRGKRIAMGGPLTSTRRLATKVMNFIGLMPGKDFIEIARTSDELAALPPDQLPDAFFVLTPLPWSPGTRVVREAGYRPLELPFGEALSLADREVSDFVIPSFTYSVDPPIPAQGLHTVATPMLLLANKDVPPRVIERVMEILFESDFSRRASLPALDARAVMRLHDFLLHPGTVAYLKRGEPVVNGELISDLENLRSFAVSAAVSLFLIWRWYRSRQLITFEIYFDAATDVEQEAFKRRSSGRLDTEEVDRLWRRLSMIKAEVLEKHASGSLSGDEELMSFLIHVNDVRASLVRLTNALASGDTDVNLAADVASSTVLDSPTT